MSFEDDMIEEGFSNELDYLDYLMNIEKERDDYTYGMSEGDSCYSPTINRIAINQYAAIDDEVNSFKSSVSVVRCANSKYMIDKYGNMI